jgi:hypothetical protein
VAARGIDKRHFARLDAHQRARLATRSRRAVLAGAAKLGVNNGCRFAHSKLASFLRTFGALASAHGVTLSAWNVYCTKNCARAGILQPIIDAQSIFPHSDDAGSAQSS